MSCFFCGARSANGAQEVVNMIVAVRASPRGRAITNTQRHSPVASLPVTNTALAGPPTRPQGSGYEHLICSRQKRLFLPPRTSRIAHVDPLHLVSGPNFSRPVLHRSAPSRRRRADGSGVAAVNRL